MLKEARNYEYNAILRTPRQAIRPRLGRLRVVENMAPLAEANKTFARLGNMCAKLFTEPEPALLLADCIALADALAVVQGSFQDVPESRHSTLEYDVREPLKTDLKSENG